MGVIVEPILESRFVDETRWIGVKDLVGTQKSAAAAAAVIVLAVVLYASIVRMCLASWEFLLPVIKPITINGFLCLPHTQCSTQNRWWRFNKSVQKQE